jgi:CheY-like chemotaxis protein
VARRDGAGDGIARVVGHHDELRRSVPTLAPDVAHELGTVRVTQVQVAAARAQRCAVESRTGLFRRAGDNGPPGRTWPRMSRSDAPTHRDRMPPRVLVVDDEPLLRRGVERILQRFGYATVGAANGAEALARYREWLPDLVLVDLHLPDMSGENLVALLRPGDAAGPPILIVTGESSVTDVVGTVGVVTKPFDVTALVELVRAHTRHASAA